MPDVLWPLFRDNPPLAKALSALAAEVIQARMSAKYGLRVGVIAILHTFNGELKFNSHVHTMVTGGGLRVVMEANNLVSRRSRGTTASDPLRQWAGADESPFSGVVRGTTDRVGTHSAW